MRKEKVMKDFVTKEEKEEAKRFAETMAQNIGWYFVKKTNPRKKEKITREELHEAIAVRKTIKAQIAENEDFLVEVLDVIEERFESFKSATVEDIMVEMDGYEPDVIDEALQNLSVYIEVLKKNLPNKLSKTEEDRIPLLEEIFSKTLSMKEAYDELFSIIANFSDFQEQIYDAKDENAEE